MMLSCGISLRSHFLMGCLKKLIHSRQGPNRKDSRNHWVEECLRKLSLINARVCEYGVQGRKLTMIWASKLNKKKTNVQGMVSWVWSRVWGKKEGNAVVRTEVWANFGRWWGTRRPGVLQSTKSQRVRHDWATEQKQQEPDRFSFSQLYSWGPGGWWHHWPCSY